MQCWFGSIVRIESGDYLPTDCTYNGGYTCYAVMTAMMGAQPNARLRHDTIRYHPSIVRSITMSLRLAATHLAHSNWSHHSSISQQMKAAATRCWRLPAANGLTVPSSYRRVSTFHCISHDGPSASANDSLTSSSALPPGTPSSSLNGVFAVYKPPGVTSTRLLASIKHRLSRLQNGELHGPLVKAGHGGTLDPLAEGVLVVGVGSGCKQLSSYLSSSKCYTVTAQLGSATDTFDAEGRTTQVAADRAAHRVTEPQVRQALTQFVGSIQQRPPAYSAVHIGGKRAYQLARSGQQPVMAERTVHVHKAELLHYDADNAQVVLRLWTGKGVYVRSIVHDLGVALGCYAHVTRLIRDKQGKWVLKRSELGEVGGEQEVLDMDELTTENVQRVLSTAAEPQPPPVPLSATMSRSLTSRLSMAAGGSTRLSARCFSSTSRNPSVSRVQLPALPLFERAVKYGNSPAVSSHSSMYSYTQLLNDASAMCDRLSAALPSLAASSSSTTPSTSIPPSVAFLVPPSYQHVVTTYGIWAAGAVSVPLHMGHKEGEISYLLDDCHAQCVVVTETEQQRIAALAKQRNIPLVVIPNQVDVSPHSDLQSGASTVQSSPADMSQAALLIYTSGTTGQPKGVVYSHAMIEAQMASLSQAWEWSSSDHILHCLPLHHVHGVVNVMLCALYNGAQCTFMDRFDAAKAWQLFVDLPLTLFMAVPTIYSRLIQHYDASSAEQQKAYRDACRKFRLMVSGSAALPTPVLRRWRDISGHVLLERYGMSEIGMALSNPLHGHRKEGFVGRPLPSVQVRIQPSDSEGDHSTQPSAAGPVTQGELLVRGPTVFTSYLNKPKATAESFTAEGWFKTGDIVRVDDQGDYAIVGRASVDVLKSAGYKLSALEIERDILAMDGMDECAVVGVEDDEYGQVVGVVAARTKGSKQPSESELKQFCKERMAREKVPRYVLFMDDGLPRNAMGKLNKKELVKLFDSVKRVAKQ